MAESSNSLKTKEKKSCGSRAVGAWCLYDWANSAFGTVIITFVYSIFFARGIIGDETQGSALWGYAIAFSGFLIALTSPVLGAVADYYGARKRWLAIFAALSIIAVALLWFGRPDPSVYNIIFILALVVVANATFELSLVFYNAMLPHIAPPHLMGRLSGWGWGLGYLGGLSCLALTLFALIGLGGAAPWLPLPQDESQHIRASALLTALWFALFAIPLLLWVRDDGRSGLSLREAVSKGLARLKETIMHVRQYGNLVRFLIASALYRDGLATLFAVGGLYAAGTFGMDFDEILIFAIGLNVTAGLGALAFAFMDDYAGSKRTIMIGLAGLIAFGAATLLVQDKTVFILLALGLGLFVGPAQAAGRTLAARLAPPGMVAQTYGLYAFTGKSIAFLGPLCFALATDIFDSQRAGIATILLFWLAGMALLMKVREP